MWLAACGATQPIVRTEVVEVRVPVYVPLDPALTADLPEPAPPAWRCQDGAGRPSVCNRDHVNYTEALRTWGRKLRAKLERVRELQPPPAERP